MIRYGWSRVTEKYTIPSKQLYKKGYTVNTSLLASRGMKGPSVPPYTARISETP